MSNNQDSMEIDVAAKDPKSGKKKAHAGSSTHPVAIKRPNNPENSESSSSSSTSVEKPPEPARKVVRVDANHPDQEVADTRRGRIELDKEQRDKVLRYILACHIRITS